MEDHVSWPTTMGARVLISDGWYNWFEDIVNAFLSGGGVIFTGKAAIDADPTHAANTMAWVIGDPVAANNDVYIKLGGAGSGSWTRVADLPYSFIVAYDEGDGAPDDIQATSSLPVSGSALVLLNVFEANVGSPVTVSFNGGAPLTIKSNSGNDIAPGGLQAGMLVMGRVSGSTFRIVNDQVSAAIIAQAEDAADRAEAAAAALNFPPIQHGDGAKKVVIKQDESGYEYVEDSATESFASKVDAEAFAPDTAPGFIRLAGYYAAGDGGGALYKTSASEPSHAGKFFVTLADGVTVQWYDYAERTVNVLALGASHTLEDNAPFFNDAVEIAQDFRMGGVVYFPAPPFGQVYNIQGSINIFKSCALRCEDVHVQIYAVGFPKSVAIINVQRGVAPNLENQSRRCRIGRNQMERRLALTAVVAAPGCFAVNGDKIRFAGPRLAHPCAKSLGKQHGIDPVHQDRQPASAGNTVIEGQQTAQEIQMLLAPVRNRIVILAVADRAAERTEPRATDAQPAKVLARLQPDRDAPAETSGVTSKTPQ